MGPWRCAQEGRPAACSSRNPCTAAKLSHHRVPGGPSPRPAREAYSSARPTDWAPGTPPDQPAHPESQRESRDRPAAAARDVDVVGRREESVADLLREGRRATDTLARVGPDDFVLLLPELPGVAVAERIAGQHGHVDFNLVPWVIYTSPEIAWVGRTEQQLKSDGVAYKAGTFPFLANGRARALGDTTGMVKFLADATTDEILGVHIVGPMASELISEAVVAMEFKASAEDIGRICHAHPSLSEATKEAALAVDKRTLNF